VHQRNSDKIDKDRKKREKIHQRERGEGEGGRHYKWSLFEWMNHNLFDSDLGGWIDRYMKSKEVPKRKMKELSALGVLRPSGLRCSKISFQLTMMSASFRWNHYCEMKLEWELSEWECGDSAKGSRTETIG
jgi:hypothetical protein